MLGRSVASRARTRRAKGADLRRRVQMRMIGPVVIDDVTAIMEDEICR